MQKFMTDYEKKQGSKKNFLQQFLSHLRLKVLQNEREKKIADILYKIIKTRKKKISICDYGSGFNPDVIRFLAKKINYKSIHCYDFYNNKQLSLLNKNPLNIKFKKIESFKKNKKKYDVAIIIDVLHHIGINNKIVKNILVNLKLKSKILIIKDHFEDSFLSRLLLQIMDWIGNYKDNVSIPNEYYTKRKLKKTLETCNFKNYRISQNYKIYSNKFLFFSQKKLHFIAIIK